MGVTKCDSKTDFDKQLRDSGDKLVVVDFYADWCGPCKMIAPKVEGFSGEFSDKVVFLKVDVDDEECQDIVKKYDISAMPTFVFIKNGEKVDSFAGANPEKLKEAIEKLSG